MKSPDNLAINSLEDLHSEMRRVKQRIKNRENDLGDRWNRLPEEAVKASITTILPAFMGSQVASGVWKLLKGAYDLLKGNENNATGSTWKDTLAGGAKQAGFFGVMKLLSTLWKGK
ncbi:MAG: hypothetical protein ABIS69_11550 [Sediminibacterium sp.]